jgi:nucleotide-binding universal stress UspA family protein
MDEAPARPRTVLVLGREARLDVEPVARRVVAEEEELILLSVGYPIAATQAIVVSDALRCAAELQLWLDVVLVTRPEQLAGLTRDGDDVSVLASGAERKKIERALGRKARGERSGRSLRLVRMPEPAASRRPTRLPTRRAHSRPPKPMAALAAGGIPGALDGSSENAPMEDHGLPEPGLVESESVEALAGREVLPSLLDVVWIKEDALTRKRAPLRVYLGAAPGVGKTYAMLAEGQRRKARGTDVVVGVVQTYDRPLTKEVLQGLEIVPPRALEYRGTSFDELDQEALLERRPEVALVDELAHTNVPGSRRAKRWEDVLDALAQGITVITTLNVQHLSSVNDVVAEITGIRQQETVPDWVLDLADDVELVDMSPRALQRRMVHGNVYTDPRKAELALRRFFTTENLTALRELALMRVANRVDDGLLARWSKGRTPETRERILVCVSPRGPAEELVGRGGRIAQRSRGDLVVVTVAVDEKGPDPEWARRLERLVRDLGGEFQVLDAEDPVEAVLSFAYQQHVTQILVGESLRPRWQELLRGSFVNTLIRKASNVDVHVIARRER